MEGWIKLHRKIIDWEWFDDEKTLKLFIYLLVSVNYESKKWKGILIERGQLITSISKLSVTLNISQQTIRTSLKRLKLTGELTSQVTNRFTLITLVNYELYQFKDDKLTSQLTSQLTSKQHPTNIQLTTTKEVKKERKKEVKKVIDKTVNSEHKDVVRIHSEFYEKKTGIKYLFKGGADGKAVKQMINYLHSIDISGKKVNEFFEALFSNWDKLETFYQERLQLTQIYSNFPIILNQIKNGKHQGKTTAKDSFETIMRKREGSQSI